MKLLTLARRLHQRKARERSGQFVAEGVRTLEVLLDSKVVVLGILAAPSLAENERGQAILARAGQDNLRILDVSEAEFASAAGTDTPQGVLAIGEIPLQELPAASRGDRYLILDAVQDPGNVGTILRTAVALGVRATITLPGTVDVWNAKVVRSAMGAHFTHPVLAMTVAETSAFLSAQKITCWAADTGGRAIGEVDRSNRTTIALLVSNEGSGLSIAAEGLASLQVRVPMAPGAESLNVAVATGILLFALGGVGDVAPWQSQTAP